MCEEAHLEATGEERALVQELDHVFAVDVCGGRLCDALQTMRRAGQRKKEKILKVPVVNREYSASKRLLHPRKQEV
jgi:hypothetical protein